MQKQNLSELIRHEISTWPKLTFSVSSVKESLISKGTPFDKIDKKRFDSLISFVLKQLRTKGFVTKTNTRGTYRITYPLPKEKETDPKEIQENNLVDWGQALYAYVGSLKDEIDKLKNQISNEQEKQKQSSIRHCQVVKEKEKLISELRDKIIVLERGESKQGTFTLEEVAHYRKQ